ncbi:MAG: hypothetical protein ACNYWU_09915 [Desulfobacterales bacterium]
MLEKLITSSSFWAIIGVFIGFILGEGARYIRYRIRISKLKRIIHDELKSLKNQIPLKEDIVQQIIAALKNQKVLSGQSVGSINIGYKKHISELNEHLSKLQRNCLHVIYENLRVADDFLDNFKKNIIETIKEKIVEEPFEAYTGYLEDIQRSYKVVSELIDSYLNKEVIDVFGVDRKRNT